MLDGFVEDHARAEMSLKDGSRRLARTKARDPRPTGETADGVVHRAAQAFGWELDLEQDG
jgi:hypothetical protein